MALHAVELSNDGIVALSLTGGAILIAIIYGVVKKVKSKKAKKARELQEAREAREWNDAQLARLEEEHVRAEEEANRMEQAEERAAKKRAADAEYEKQVKVIQQLDAERSKLLRLDKGQAQVVVTSEKKREDRERWADEFREAEVNMVKYFPEGDSFVEMDRSSISSDRSYMAKVNEWNDEIMVRGQVPARSVLEGGTAVAAPCTHKPHTVTQTCPSPPQDEHVIEEKSPEKKAYTNNVEKLLDEQNKLRMESIEKKLAMIDAERNLKRAGSGSAAQEEFDRKRKEYEDAKEEAEKKAKERAAAEEVERDRKAEDARRRREREKRGKH